jgi:hypothetical protein
VKYSVEDVKFYTEFYESLPLYNCLNLETHTKNKLHLLQFINNKSNLISLYPQKGINNNFLVYNSNENSKKIEFSIGVLLQISLFPEYSFRLYDTQDGSGKNNVPDLLFYNDEREFFVEIKRNTYMTAASFKGKNRIEKLTELHPWTFTSFNYLRDMVTSGAKKNNNKEAIKNRDLYVAVFNCEGCIDWLMYDYLHCNNYLFKLSPLGAYHMDRYSELAVKLSQHFTSILSLSNENGIKGVISLDILNNRKISVYVADKSPRRFVLQSNLDNLRRLT